MKTAALLALSALTLTSCATAVGGVPMSPLTDSARVGGVVIAAADSGTRTDAPAPTVRVQGTDGGSIDRLGALAVDDVQEFWARTPLPGGGEYTPLAEVASWDARSGTGETVCGIDAKVNAAFCPPEASIGWDRGGLMPVLVESTGDLAAALIVSHEIGHYIDRQTSSFTDPVIVKEQRADCFAGSYFAWAAEGNSPRFMVDSAGLDLMLEALPVIADNPDVDGDHGSATDRLWAFQQGFMRGADSCAQIDLDTVQAHRDGVPMSGGDANVRFTQSLVKSIAEATEQVTGVQPDVSVIDVDALDDMSSDPVPGVRGDGTGAAALIAVLVQPWLAEQPVSSPRSTACAVGAVARGLSSDGMLSAGDLDEMVIEILTVGLGATDTAGDMPSSGFERVRGFLSGVYGGLDGCAA